MHTLPLRLIIQDEQDLLVASAHLEGAVLQVSNMTYLPAQKRFAFMIQRPDMEHSTGLHFDYVEKVQTQNLPENGESFTCLACIFEPIDAPAGIITLFFDGAPRIRLFVECLDAGMGDL